MEKVLVLGSSGQIGAPLVKYLRKNGIMVTEFDILNGGDQDLRTRHNEQLRRCIKDSDMVYFLAFDVGGAKYLHNHQNTYDFINNNIRIMANTFEMLTRYDRPFIWASSQMADMTESTYGLLKKVGERYTNAIGGLNVKLWNVYGAEEISEKSHVIPDFILNAKRNNKIEMMTDGTEVRQLLHVDDFSECMISLGNMYNKLDKTKPYHVTNFEWISILDLAKEVASNFEGVEVIPAAKKDIVQPDRKKEPDEYILQYWQPKISLSEGIKDMIERMKEHE